MKNRTKCFALAIGVVAWAILVGPESAQAQTTAESVRGTWVSYAGGGFSKTLLQFNTDGAFSVQYTDSSGKKVEDTGKFVVVAETVVATGSAGEKSRMYFFWQGSDTATIRLVPEGSSRNVEAVFTRIRKER